MLISHGFYHRSSTPYSFTRLARFGLEYTATEDFRAPFSRPKASGSYVLFFMAHLCQITMQILGVTGKTNKEDVVKLVIELKKTEMEDGYME